MKYNVLMTLGGSVISYDDITGEPIDIDQTGCPTEVLGTFESEDESRKFLEDYIYGRTNLPYKEGNKSFQIKPIEEE